MTRKTRTTDGSIVILTLALVAGTALAAGPALAQETTVDGMGGNETMADGTGTMEDGTGDNETTTDETVNDGDGSMGDGESTGDGAGTSMDDEMGTESMGDDSMTEDGVMDEGGEEGMDEETVSGGQPGFGLIIALAALVAAVTFVRYRRR